MSCSLIHWLEIFLRFWPHQVSSQSQVNLVHFMERYFFVEVRNFYHKYGVKSGGRWVGWIGPMPVVMLANGPDLQVNNTFVDT